MDGLDDSGKNTAWNEDELLPPRARLDIARSRPPKKATRILHRKTALQKIANRILRGEVPTSRARLETTLGKQLEAPMPTCAPAHAKRQKKDLRTTWRVLSAHIEGAAKSQCACAL